MANIAAGTTCPNDGTLITATGDEADENLSGACPVCQHQATVANLRYVPPTPQVNTTAPASAPQVGIPGAPAYKTGDVHRELDIVPPGASLGETTPPQVAGGYPTHDDLSEQPHVADPYGAQQTSANEPYNADAAAVQQAQTTPLAAGTEAGGAFAPDQPRDGGGNLEPTHGSGG